MIKQNKISNLAFKFGMLGMTGVTMGMLIAIALEVTSLADFFSYCVYNSVSQLGTYSRSPSAVILNGGLFFGSLTASLGCVFALQASNGFAVRLFWLCIAVQFVSLAAMGLFPMNVYHLHINALLTYVTLGVFVAGCFILVSGNLSIKVKVMGRIIAVGLLVIHGCLLVIPQYMEWSQGEPLVNFFVVAERMTSVSPRPSMWWQAWGFWLCLILQMGLALMMLYTQPHQSAEQSVAS
ncbi:hypothetical protein ACFOD0_06325 [Shewanella intestini]|uniref:DUF998 domain-containing protein n=1 Tax=Shewanella intestini TaxID=2017544 RepID=A0ABS5HYL0_9GAMM|nr:MULTISPECIES: hypothetical protein [Shewanella]MBR9726494.1 hypothetical protein [Shewanella intestini]MRG34940.1 hypothetical protein [Shewanella sp. XMDDZSB0408]